MNKPLFYLLGLFVILSTLSCYTDATSFEADPSGAYAIPLVDTEATLLAVTDKVNSNAIARVDEDGKVTVVYKGGVTRRDAREVFAVVPGEFIPPMFVTDSVGPIPIPDAIFPANFQLDKGHFEDVNLWWYFEHSLEEDITLEITIPEFSGPSGEVYKENFVIPYTGTTPVSLTTPFYDIDKYVMTTSTNSFGINYKALRPNGERIVLDSCQLLLDKVDLSYIEGFFGREVNELSGEVIEVGAFSNWVSGGLFFEDPSVSIFVENSFGFPVRAEFNEVKLTNVLDEDFLLESVFIDNGVDFSFPVLPNINEVKLDTFIFDVTNSNIQEVFNERVKRVTFDADAVANPEDDPNIIGFMTDTSYYEIFVEVVLPLLAKANDLVLTDTFEMNLSEYNEIEAAEFKLVLENDFPFDMELQAQFIDANGVIQDSLFKDGPYIVEAATILSGGTTQSKGQQTEFINVDRTRFDKIRQGNRLVLKAKFKTPDEGQSAVWFYDDYALDLKLGVILNLNGE